MMKELLLFSFCFIVTTITIGQNDIEQITATLNNYIVGSTQGQPDRLASAFHPDFNLYYVDRQDSLRIYSGQEFIASTTPGKLTGEVGKIISIDYEHTAAIAKVEVHHAAKKRTTVDYFLLQKIEGVWKIIHKVFTKKVY